MPYQCYGCGSNFVKDSSLRGHLNSSNSDRNCRKKHDAIIQSQIEAARQSPVDLDDPEQWQPNDLHDPEPRDDFYLLDTGHGRLPSVSEADQLSADRATKRNRSGTIDRQSLVKAELRPFPNAAKVIWKGEPIPWEVHVRL